MRHRQGSTIALIAALVLVLQSFLSVWAAGAHAATPMLDAFGNPLCISSAEHDGTNPANDHYLTDCCALGCNMASPLHASGSDDRVGLLRPLSSDNARLDPIEGLHTLNPDHDPGSPRAPPLTA